METHFFAIDSNDKIVWEYISLVDRTGVLKQGDNLTDFSTNLFRTMKCGANYPPVFVGRDLSLGSPAEKILTWCSVLQLN